jgi:hypothetical protein
MRIALLLLMLGLSASAQASSFDHAHGAWRALLASHVTWVQNGAATEVDYAGFSRDERALANYLQELSVVSSEQYEGWSRPRQLAYLINSYNAFTVKLILDHQPVSSIRQIGGLFTSPWEIRFIPLLGKKLSLDQIEHGMIREPGVFDEPRIHFAVNCASMGCPALRPEPYVADQLGEQLEDSERRFLGDRSRNRYNEEKGRFEVSKLFDWYGEDFTQRWGSLNAYLDQHSRLVGPPPGNASKARIVFLEYDWSLNSIR